MHPGAHAVFNGTKFIRAALYHNAGRVNGGAGQVMQNKQRKHPMRLKKKTLLTQPWNKGCLSG